MAKVSRFVSAEEAREILGRLSQKHTFEYIGRVCGKVPSILTGIMRGERLSIAQETMDAIKGCENELAQAAPTKKLMQADRVSTAESSEIINRLLARHSKKYLAEQLGLDKTTISDIASRRYNTMNKAVADLIKAREQELLNAEPTADIRRRQGYTGTAECLRIINRLYGSGINYPKIAQFCNVNVQVIYNIVHGLQNQVSLGLLGRLRDADREFGGTSVTVRRAKGIGVISKADSEYIKTAAKEHGLSFVCRRAKCGKDTIRIYMQEGAACLNSVKNRILNACMDLNRLTG